MLKLSGSLNSFLGVALYKCPTWMNDCSHYYWKRWMHRFVFIHTTFEKPFCALWLWLTVGIGVLLLDNGNNSSERTGQLRRDSAAWQLFPWLPEHHAPAAGPRSSSQLQGTRRNQVCIHVIPPYATALFIMYTWTYIHIHECTYAYGTCTHKHSYALYMDSVQSLNWIQRLVFIDQ